MARVSRASGASRVRCFASAPSASLATSRDRGPHDAAAPHSARPYAGDARAGPAAAAPSRTPTGRRAGRTAGDDRDFRRLDPALPPPSWATAALFTVAQVAMGRTAPGEALRLTLVVPSSVSLGGGMQLAGEGRPQLEPAWRRCLSSGCFADLALDEATVERLRAGREPGRFTFLDDAGREVALPFSSNGLAAALEALGRETGR